MRPETLLARLLIRGSALDAYASFLSEWLAARVPSMRERLAANTLDEKRHSTIQAAEARRLDPDVSIHGDGFPRSIFRLWREDGGAVWPAVVLNLLEWRGELSFRVLARRCQAIGLAQTADVLREIAEDERRHVVSGWDTIASLGGAPPPLIMEAARCLYGLEAQDDLCHVLIPQVLGLQPSARANLSIAERLADLQTDPYPEHEWRGAPHAHPPEP